MITLPPCRMSRLSWLGRSGLAKPSRSQLFSTLLRERQYQWTPGARRLPELLRSNRGPPSPLSHPSYSTTTSKVTVDSKISSFAFAFDIDGVLLRSSKALPGASKALSYLHEHSIPFILLTNGGGKHETERVAELSEKFGVPLTVENFVQSHTPYQELVDGSEEYPALKEKTVLVAGGELSRVRGIAEKYGFQNVVTTADILQAYPQIWPFNQFWDDYYESVARPVPVPITPDNPSKSLKIDAILVFNDPRDWALDQQIMLDLLWSQNGILGTYSPKNGDPSLPNNGWQQDGQPLLFFSNPDLFWAAAYHLPRLGQGGFRASLEGLYTETTNGAKLYKTIIGKPYRETYKYAERVLQKHRRELFQAKFRTNHISQLRRVFMIGDNPESDIRGANEFESPDGTQWTSVLVKTGVFREGTVPKYKPEAVVPDVLAAVEWALAQEGFEGDKEKVANL